MSALSLSAKLDRTDSTTSWGFRLHGGKDFGCPLTIQRVTPGSLAQKCGLQVGDTIVKIGGTPTSTLRHKEAQQGIMQAGNSLELALERGSFGGGAPHSPPAAAPSAYTPTYQPQSQNQSYNQPAKPFSSNSYGGSAVDGITNQTAGMSIGQHQPGATPPWKSSPSGVPTSPTRVAPAHAPAHHAPAAPIGARPGAWQPKIPTGPRTPKIGATGTARTVPAGSGRVPVCNGCGTTIRGPFVMALDKTWCPDHFVCANPNCRIQLVGVGFVEEDGQLFCVNDYEKYLAPRCGKCGRAIVGEVVNALKNTFHTDCFVCAHCGAPVGSGNFHQEDAKIYCEKDWASMFQTKCYGCSFPIEPGDRWVEALSQNWHSECFNCSTCQCNLEGQSFFAKGGRPYCKRHTQGGGC